MSDHQDHHVDQPDDIIPSSVVLLNPFKNLLPVFSISFSLFLALPPVTLDLEAPLSSVPAEGAAQEASRAESDSAEDELASAAIVDS